MNRPEQIAVREYWTPQQTADVLGRSQGYWKGLYARGLVNGYSEGNRRYLSASSAREYLDSLCARNAPASEFAQAQQNRKEALAAFRARQQTGTNSEGAGCPTH